MMKDNTIHVLGFTCQLRSLVATDEFSLKRISASQEPERPRRSFALASWGQPSSPQRKREKVIFDEVGEHMYSC